MATAMALGRRRGTPVRVRRHGGVRRAASEGAAAAPAATTTSRDAMMEELSDFLWADLPNLFNDTGIDTSRYNEQIAFRDPITSYDTLGGACGVVAPRAARPRSPSHPLHHLYIDW